VKSIPDMVDRGYELKKQLKDMTEESDNIKIALREFVIKQEESKLGSGETIEVKGKKHKAKINLSEDSFCVAEGVTTNEILRMKAIIGSDAMTIEEGVKFKNGISLKKVKEKLGETFYELFEDDIKTKFDAQKMTEWIKERKRNASNNDMANFVVKKINKKSNTAKVTFSL
jgi:hypothetical protein